MFTVAEDANSERCIISAAPPKFLELFFSFSFWLVGFPSPCLHRIKAAGRFHGWLAGWLVPWSWTPRAAAMGQLQTMDYMESISSAAMWNASHCLRVLW
jgi:hypothetical protein